MAQVPTAVAGGRMCYSFLNLSGRDVVLTLVDGRVLSGIFLRDLPLDKQGSSQQPRFAIVVTGERAPTGWADVAEFTRDESWFNWSDVETLECAGAGGIHAYAQNSSSGAARTATPAGIKTDVQVSSGISRNAKGVKTDRKLEALDASWLEAGDRPASALSSATGEYDQFAAVERATNKKSTYSEDLYTTPLNTTTLTPAQIAAANAAALEISNDRSSDNVHLREERGQIPLGGDEDDDEEARYGAVLGSGAYAPKRSNASSYAAAATKKRGAAKPVQKPVVQPVKPVVKPPVVKSPVAPAPAKPTAPKSWASITAGPVAAKKPIAAPPTQQPASALEKKRKDRRVEQIASFKEFSKSLEQRSPKQKKPTSRSLQPLRAEAKEFVLNTAAPAFVPGGGSVAPAPPQEPRARQFMVPYPPEYANYVPAAQPPTPQFLPQGGGVQVIPPGMVPHPGGGFVPAATAFPSQGNFFPPPYPFYAGNDARGDNTNGEF